jgi:hypothetical protein
MAHRSIHLLAAAALAGSSIAASAARAPVAPVAPAAQTVEGSELRRSPAIFILPLLVVIALLVAMLNEDEAPASP